MCTPINSEIPVKLASQAALTKSGAAPKNAIRRPMPCINMPGDYSGDIWHIAAAMVVWCDLHVIITKQKPKKAEPKDSKTRGGKSMAQRDEADEPDNPDTQRTKEDSVTENSVNFLLSIGIAADRVHVVEIANLDIEGSTVGMKQRLRDIRAVEGHRDQAKQMRGSLGLGEGEVFAVYASTYIWITAIRRFGTDSVLRRVQAAFVKDFEMRAAATDVAAKIRADVANLGASKSPFLLLNMRVSSYHPEDNTTEDIYHEISRVAKTNNIRLVLIGAWNPKNKQHNSPEGIWMRDLAGQIIPIYSYLRGVGIWSDWQSVAYMWLQLARLKQCRGVIGGRSGSLDVAGLMGHRLLCWTIFRSTDPGYQRVQLMVVPPSEVTADGELRKSASATGTPPLVQHFMSIVDYNKLEPEHQIVESFTPNYMRVAPGVAGAVLDCLGRARQTFAPQLEGNVVLQDDKLHSLIKIPELALCEQLTAAPGPVSVKELEGGRSFDALAWLWNKFVIANADGEGNNCLLHSLYQLRNGITDNLSVEGVRERVKAMREALCAAAPSIKEDEMLDIYSEEGALLLRALGLRVRVIQIDVHNIIRDGPPVGDTTLPEWRTQYLLYTPGHYRPMWIRDAYLDPRNVAKEDLAAEKTRKEQRS